MIVGEFLVKLGFSGAGEMLNKLDSLKATTFRAVSEMNKLTEAARQHAYMMEVYEKTTGKSADQLQNLSYRAAQFNITQEELANTLRNIQQISTNVRLGRGMPSAFSLFGIDPNQDPAQILSQLQNAINTLDAPTALNIASELGIDEKMFYMLKMSSKEMGELNKQYRVTAQERSNLMKLNAEWQKFWFLLKQIQTKFQATTSKFQADLLAKLLEIIDRASEMASSFMKALEASKALKIAVIALGIAMTAAFSPALLLLGAIFLVFEDIYTYLQGGDSITGRIAEWVSQIRFFGLNLENVFTILIEVKDILEAIIEKTKQAGTALGNLVGKNSKDSKVAKEAAAQGEKMQWLFEHDREEYNRLHPGKINNNTINNTFYSNEAPTREDIAGATSDAMRQLEAAA